MRQGGRGVTKVIGTTVVLFVTKIEANNLHLTKEVKVCVLPQCTYTLSILAWQKNNTSLQRVTIYTISLTH